MQHYTIHYIIVNALHVSGGFSAHHQELKNCKHGIWYVPALLAATESVVGSMLAAAPDKPGTYQMLCVQFLSSWWWAEKPPETCRADIPKLCSAEHQVLREASPSAPQRDCKEK